MQLQLLSQSSDDEIDWMSNQEFIKGMRLKSAKQPFKVDSACIQLTQDLMDEIQPKPKQ